MKAVGARERTPLYAPPVGATRPLRVTLVGPPQVPGWVRAFHGLVAGYDWIELTTLSSAGASLPKVAGVPASVRALIAFERALLGPTRSLTAMPMPSGPHGDAVLATAGPGDEATLVERIAGARPDLLIVLGTKSWASALAAQTKCACWLVDASLLDDRHAGLQLLGPMLRRETATRMVLVLHAPNQTPVDLAASWGRTRATSFLKQREDAFRKLPALLLRALRRLAQGDLGAGAPAMASLELQPLAPLAPAAGLHAFASMLRASPRWMTGWFRNARVGWTLVLRLGGAPLDPHSPTIGSHALLKAPKGWWGDPFVVMAQERRLLFVEEMLEPRLKKATIACVELGAGGARSLGVALDEPGHLSFPQVFAWEGQWYMTVESGYDRRVSLYRASDFPLRWERVHDLVVGRVCVDPSLHHHQGHWYLFANVAENQNNTCDELFLFVADRLEGPYTPHPASPIVCDVRRARMAGRLFQRNGSLIRPAQDCGPGYGNAVVFNEVLELGPTTYRERQLSRLAPYLTRSVDGCHTYNVAGGVEVLDVLGRPPNRTAYVGVLDERSATDTRARAPVPGAVDPAASPGPPPVCGPAHPGSPPR
ncbi:hypothetical protein [Lysobacter sp. Root983]|uniref:glucosamine inositolphosphorylceramide transferase family protein n=1 Tax=Lysobacter sp. Root983 TaxID=1736613 RepID=UPI00070F7A31|nr:hypothetical protein [Lysobacter sp. Root983]KRD80131.1 hypothetical protein ASE43_04440 [Lysobacter sp. Root983]